MRLDLRQLGQPQSLLHSRKVGRHASRDHARVARPVLRLAGQAVFRQRSKLGVGPAAVEPRERIGRVAP